MRGRTIVLTIPVTALLTQPLWAPQWGAGVLGEFAGLGIVWGSAAIAVFFGLVALFVMSLQRMLGAIPASARARSPRSIWLMCAIPFNFVEDFEIVTDIASSLRADGRTQRLTVTWWWRLGIAWAAAQIVSLLPGAVGLIGGALAIVAWIAHWTLTAVLTRRLRQGATGGSISAANAAA